MAAGELKSRGSKMSEKAEKQAESAGGGKKSGLLLVVLVTVVMLALGGGAAWFFLSHKSGGAEHVAEAKAAKAEQPVFFTLEPFVVNLAGEETRYLQVGIDLKVADSHVIDKIKVHMPEIKNGVLLLLSSKKPEELSSLEGKNQLRGEIRDAVNRPLGIQAEAAAAHPAGEAKESEHGKEEKPIKLAAAQGGVVDVLLTSFVIQ
jgi:flagellar FliL protein